MPTKVIKKILDDLKQNDEQDLKIVDQSLSNIVEIQEIFTLKRLTRLTLSHNKLTTLPAQIAELHNLEQLNLSNNQIEELPTALSSLPNLKILKLCFNRLSILPRGFGAFPVLEILDLTSNLLTSKSFPSNFFELKSLRALYLGDNHLDCLSTEIYKLENLNILVLRDNDLYDLPNGLELLKNLKELHVQSNRLQLLSPNLTKLDIFNTKSILKMENNPWISQIIDSYKIGLNHLADYLSTDEYQAFYNQEIEKMTRVENLPASRLSFKKNNKK